MKMFRYIILLLLLSITDGQSYIEVPLDGLITDRKQEISGMTTYKDNLILLPENLNGTENIYHTKVKRKISRS